MGDVAIADGLKLGAKAVINAMGESVTICRTGSERRDPNRPNRRLPAEVIQYSIEATLSDVRDDLIDGVLVKSGDKTLFLLGGQELVGTIDGVEQPARAFIPQVGDVVDDTGNSRFTVVRVKTNRVSGVDTSYELLIR